MSIIHEALKKVQQGLDSKDTVETLPPLQQAASPKTSLKSKIQNILALGCALLITAGACFYIYQQFRHDIPKVKNFAQKSFDQLTHKEELPAFKTKSPEELQSLAQITISPTAVKNPDTTSASDPVTLNVHGIMSNASGNLALINDEVYQEGDEVDGAKIIKISLDSITIDINGMPKTIFVKN